MIPAALAWLGVVASYVWLPMLAFELTLAIWPLIKGVPHTVASH